MIMITDNAENKMYLDDILSAFETYPEFTIKSVQCRSTTTKETIDKAIDNLNDACVILIGSSLLRAYTGNNPKKWDIQPVRKDEVTVYATPSLGYVIRKSHDLTMMAKVLSAAMFLEQTGGEDFSLSDHVPIESLQGMRQCFDHVRQTGLMCFDFETFTDSDDTKDYEWYQEDFHASLLSICPQPGISYTLPMTHKDNPIVPHELDEAMVLVKELFADPDIRKIGQNVKYDMHVARRIGIDKLEGRYDDTMLMAAILDNSKKSYGLKQMAAEIFPSTLGYDDEVHQYEWKNIPLDILGRYAANDTNLTMLLCATYEQRMEDRLMVLYRNLVAPAIKTLQKMEYRGMLVDLNIIDEGIAYANELEKEIESKLRSIPQVVRFQEITNRETIEKTINQEEAKIADWRNADRTTDHYEKRSLQKIRDIKTGKLIVTEPINFGSHVQIKSLIYSQDGFAYKTLAKTTAENVLRDIDDPTGFISGLLKLRSISKTRSTYLMGIRDKVVNGRLHTTFTQHVTSTGRLSSRKPNLQNLPNIYKIKDEDLVRLVGYVKKAFIAPEDHSILQFDLSQAELRFMAEFSEDDTMVNSYKEGKDLHAVAAAANLNISLDEFYKLDEKAIKDHRFRAKARNFGLIYLMSPQGYKEYAKDNYHIDLTMSEAISEHEAFFRLYPGIRRYHRIYEAKAKKHGKVRNWFGRQCWLPNINHPDTYRSSMDLRLGINMPIQGTSGDYMTLALVHIDQRMGDDIQLVNTIHDSAIPYIKTSQLDYYIPLILDCLNNPLAEELFDRKWKFLQMKSDVEASEKSWADLKEINIK